MSWEEGAQKSLKCCVLSGQVLKVWMELEPFEFRLLYYILPKPANSSDLEPRADLQSPGHVCAAQRDAA